MATNNRFWTEEETNRAIELFDANYSAAKIADMMNEEKWRDDCPKITRNAIVGLLHRNGCNRDKKVKIVTIKQKTELKAKKAVKQTIEEVVEKEPLEIEEEPQRSYSSIVDLLAGECRFPIGELEAEDFRFCCGKIDYTLNHSYCTEHYRLCYYPARKQLNETNNPRRS